MSENNNQLPHNANFSNERAVSLWETPLGVASSSDAVYGESEHEHYVRTLLAEVQEGTLTVKDAKRSIGLRNMIDARGVDPTADQSGEQWHPIAEHEDFDEARWMPPTE